MTVAELIKELSEYPQDMEVCYNDSEYGNSPVQKIAKDHIYGILNGEDYDVIYLSEY